MLPLQNKLFWVCLISSTLCLVAGYGLSGRWEGLLIVLGIAISWLLLSKRYVQWLPSFLLLVYIAAAAAGLLAGLAPILMIAGVTTALGSWETQQFHQNLKGDRQHELARLLQKRHDTWSGLAVFLGLLLPGAGLYLHFHFSFGILALITLVAIVGLYRTFHILKKPGQ